MNFTINFTSNPSNNVIDIIHEGLENHAQQSIGKTSFEPFGFLVNDTAGDLVGGCTGVLMYGYAYIKLLWVAESVRGKGLGRRLIEQVEIYAKENKCRYVTVDTFNWQAKGFYEKMEYVVEHTYDGYDCDGQFYFFRKKLSNSSVIISHSEVSDL